MLTTSGATGGAVRGGEGGVGGSGGTADGGGGLPAGGGDGLPADVSASGSVSREARAASAEALGGSSRQMGRGRLRILLRVAKCMLRPPWQQKMVRATRAASGRYSKTCGYEGEGGGEGKKRRRRTKADG